ncbi:prepilin peptidase [Vibrio breoganii]|uniref:prepilin peptidase n=1 Tax=Vibrio breoganii TaxID=553239 RepID=UPI000C816D1A|nr:prepilin peptidase [Vibrio breoganii]
MLYVYLLLLTICITDILERKIYNIQVIVLFFMLLILSQRSFLEITESISMLSILSLILFSAHIWGGGDSKLLISISPLFPPSHLLDLLVAILLCGGILSIVYWLKLRIVCFKAKNKGLPYGVAIICGANLSLYFS